ncbi:putative magnesium or manganese-dependent protein phosphatase [Actinacidiphila reveromycinica]|uniref:Putative magnesium or manganese-dependent protein phosphatase n=1 Tax=Actinacidiphila reveromycinica TaxID=659352 RepID=A0A7U3UW06_9ACTN|nr:SpoIIE family protein phosphatase [Streptomyces sp. SN-593]BBA99833.1 putative magnesium or manganese-dependent protein phosphatase [Streptomyces sp. SN-593]
MRRARGDAALVVDARGTVVSCTGRAADLFGCAPGTLRGRGVAELFESPGTWSVLEAGARDGRQNTGGVVLLRPGGGTLPVRLRVSVLAPDGPHGAHFLLRMAQGGPPGPEEPGPEPAARAPDAAPGAAGNGTTGNGTSGNRAEAGAAAQESAAGDDAPRAEVGPLRRPRLATAGPDASLRADLRYASASAIGGSLDITRNADDLAAVLVPAFADLAAVDLTVSVLQGEEPAPFTGDTPLRRVAVAAVGGWPREVYPRGATLAVGDVASEQVRRGAAGALPDLTELRSLLSANERARLFLPPDATSLLLMPVQARGLVLGTVLLWRLGDRRRFDEDDAGLADEIASRAALSIDNARRYTKERRAVETLQRSLLPRVVGDSTAAETSGVYVPGGTPEGIGGSWFDVIELSSARVAFLVGRVPGHGLGATAAMGRLRAAVGTLADLDPAPDELLSHLDDLVVRFANTDDGDPVQAGIETALRGASCVYATYDPLTGRCVIASAGHPGPVLVRGGAAAPSPPVEGTPAAASAAGSPGAGEAPAPAPPATAPAGEPAEPAADTPAGAPADPSADPSPPERPPPEPPLAAPLAVEHVELNAGPPLGTGGGPFETTELLLSAGDVLAFHSDGAVRQDDPARARRQAAVEEVARAAAESGRPMADAGRELLGRLSDPAPDHDQTLLLARTRELPADRTAGWTVAAGPEAVAEVRSGVTARMADWDLDDLAFSTELIVSELVTNAIRYAGAPITVRLILDQRLICEVSDPSQTQPHLRRARLTDEGGRGLFLIAQLTHRWGSRYTPGGKTIWTEQLLTPG